MFEEPAPIKLDTSNPTSKPSQTAYDSFDEPEEEKKFQEMRRKGGRVIIGKGNNPVYFIRLELSKDTLLDPAKIYRQLDNDENLKLQLRKVGREIFKKMKKNYSHQVITIALVYCETYID